MARSRPRQAALPGEPKAPTGRDAGWVFESRAWAQGFRAVAGVDEVGRGALAGPVLAAAVVFPPGCRPTGLRDSKLLTPARREALALEITDQAAAVALARVEADVVDRINVLQATLVAMSRAVALLAVRPDFLLLDAVRMPGTRLPQRRIVHGDRLSASIAAASIIAKVERDRLMVEFGKTYPYYGFGEHKGYGTRAHIEALERLGPSPIHRRSFRRVGTGEGDSQLF